MRNCCKGITAVGAVCLSLCSVSKHVNSDLPQRWVGKDINKLTEKEALAFEKYASKLIKSFGKVQFVNWYFPDPSGERDETGFVWNFSGRSNGPYIIYLTLDPPMIPGASTGWTFIVNNGGKVLDHSNFDIGWRMYPKRAVFQNVPWLNSKVIVQEMEPEALGDGPRRIYLAFDRTEPVVVRLEDGHGKLFRMNYFASNWVVGPKFKNRTKSLLLDALKGSSDVRKMEALIWLSGNHKYSNSDVSDSRKSEDFDRIQVLVKDKSVSAAIKSLRNNPNHYVKQLALMVRLGSS